MGVKCIKKRANLKNQGILRIKKFKVRQGKVKEKGNQTIKRLIPKRKGQVIKIPIYYISR